MKRILILLTSAICVSSFIQAQTTEDSVKAVVNQLFTAMRNVDGAMLRDAFADSAILQTVAQRRTDGVIFIRSEKISDFEKSISSAKKDSLDERIVFETVKIDGSLASVWTPYKFYYAGKFSHCGANSFQLVRINGRWKIQYLIDTRRRQGCE